jgi:hypothetical protein
MMKTYQKIASALDARIRSEQNNNTEWYEKHTDIIENILKNDFPHGSGFDMGTKLVYEKSTPNKLVFQADFHHMDEHGYYDGWSEHEVIVTPSLVFGFDVKVTGRNKRNIKEYISDTFHHILTLEPDSLTSAA